MDHLRGGYTDEHVSSDADAVTTVSKTEKTEDTEKTEEKEEEEKKTTKKTTVKPTTKKTTKATECYHKYQDATCTEPAKCVYCGATTGGMLGHDYEEGVCTDCGQKDPDYVEIIEVSWLDLDAYEETIYVGDTLELDCDIDPYNATIKTLTWESTDPSVATVDQNGVVTGVHPARLRLS